MTMPEDPFMLLSFVNMKLRDGEFSSLEELCDNIGCNENELIKKLKEAGFEYMPQIKQFR